MSSAVTPISQILHRPDIWQGKRKHHHATPTIASGHAALDALLPGGGWPLGVVTEFCYEQIGLGEMSLLLPALAQITRNDQYLALIAAPYPVYAPALAAAQLQLAQCLLVSAHSAVHSLWAAEQLLRGGACAGIVLWWDGADANALRRLQLAAELGRALCVVLRPASAAAKVSPAALRLHIRGNGLFDIFKCRGRPWHSARRETLKLFATHNLQGGCVALA